MAAPSPGSMQGIHGNRSSSSPSPGGAGAGDAVGFLWINIMTYVFLSSVMFGIGSTVELDALKNVIRARKTAFAVGMVSQYLVVPAAARFVASVVLDMPTLHAFVIILIGCCPGGAVSNAFALFGTFFISLFLPVSTGVRVPSSTSHTDTIASDNNIAHSPCPTKQITQKPIHARTRTKKHTHKKTHAQKNTRTKKHTHSRPYKTADADIAMSIAMTTVSNILAFASLPLLLFLWTLGLPGDIEFAIPFLEIFYSLLMVLIPGVGGIWLRAHHPSKAKIAGKVGTFGAALLIVSSILVGFITNIDTLADANILPWKNIVAVMLVAPLGMAFAFAATLVIGKFRGQRIELPAMATIVIETGVQNSVLAMAIVSLSYSSKLANTLTFFQLQLIVIMWGIMVSFEALCVTLVFRWYIKGGNCVAFCSKEGPNSVEPEVLDSVGEDASRTPAGEAGVKGGVAAGVLEVEAGGD